MAAIPVRHVRSLLASALIGLGLIATAGQVAAAEADDLTIEAHALLEGHGRVGAWMAIAVDVTNAGPPIVGELRIAGGSQGRTRFSVPADLPTGSSKRFFMYAQPPAFGTKLDILLVVAEQTVTRSPVAFTLHEQNQLVVGVVAEKAQGIAGTLDLQPGQNGVVPAVVTLDPTDLPERVEGWSALDRLVWQDVDTNALSSDQLGALKGWLAAGGQLVIVGGTAGPGILSALPDEILPYRPSATVLVAPTTLGSLVAELPSAATDLPALGGRLERGRALASSGDVTTAAEAAYGNGIVTILGIDPTTEWIAESGAGEAIWQRLLPQRTGVVVAPSDDSQMISAAGNLPSLALPPVGGLLAILAGYIILIGPVNYLVLRRLDRREWAWFTMPALIVVFAVGSYGFGAALRGSDILVNEIALVRGAPGATEGQAQVYLGIFSPSRASYQLSVPGGALLSAPISADAFGNDAGSALDVVQTDPGKVRNLSVGFGSLRAVRAETAAVVPELTAELTLSGDRLTGVVRNLSDRTLERPAIVLGGNVVTLSTLTPGSSLEVNHKIGPNQFGQDLASRVLGQAFINDPTGGQSSDYNIRSSMLNHLTFDPQWGGPSGMLQAEGPVLLAWGREQVLTVEIEGQKPRRSGQVLYYIPLALAIEGPAVFRSDLTKNSIVALDANLFSKGVSDLSFGQGSVTMSYRPIVFHGTLAATRLLVGMGFGGEFNAIQPKEIAARPLEEVVVPVPDDCATPPCNNAMPRPILEPVPAGPGVQPIPAQPVPAFADGLPSDVEIFDRISQEWMTLGHLDASRVFSIGSPDHYVDPATGAVMFRFVNRGQDQIGFQFNIQIEGDVS